MLDILLFSWKLESFISIEILFFLYFLSIIKSFFFIEDVFLFNFDKSFNGGFFDVFFFSKYYNVLSYILDWLFNNYS